MTANPEGVRTVSQAPELRNAELPAEVPVLFLVSQVIFPYGASQVRLRMPSNLKLLDDLPGPDAVFAVAFAPGNDPEKVKAEDIGKVGVAARVIARLKLPDGSEQVTIQGLRRIHIAEVLAETPYFRARVACVVERPAEAKLAEREIQWILKMVEDISKLDASVQAEHVAVLRANVGDAGRFADMVPTVLGFDVEEQRQVLEQSEVLARLQYVAARVQDKLDFTRVVQDTDVKTRADIDRTQREAYLRRQLKVLHEELGEELHLAAVCGGGHGSGLQGTETDYRRDAEFAEGRRGAQRPMNWGRRTPSSRLLCGPPRPLRHCGNPSPFRPSPPRRRLAAAAPPSAVRTSAGTARRGA